MKKIVDAIDRVSTWTAVGCFVLMAIIMTINIFARLFSGGLTWYMESSQYLNVWSVFIAGVGLCAANDHLRIDAIDGFLKGNLKKWTRFVTALVTAIFYAALAVAFFHLASKSRQVVATMPYLKMAYVYWPVPILCILSAIATVLRAIHDVRAFGQEEDTAC